MALLDTILRRGSAAGPEAVAAARQMPNALRFSRFRTEEEFAQAGRDLGDRYARAATEAERQALQAEINSLQNAFMKFTGETVSKGARFGDDAIGATERAILESKYQGRYLDPKTGYPQSMSGRPVMADPRSAEESLAAALNTVQGMPARSPGGVDYLYRRSRALSPEGYPMSVRGPGGQMQKLEGFTPGQRLAQLGAAGTVGGALTASGRNAPEMEEPGYTGEAGRQMTEAMVPEPGYSGAGGQMLERALQVAAQQQGANAAPSEMGRYGMNQFSGATAAGPSFLRRNAAPAAPAGGTPAGMVPADQAQRPPRVVREEPGILSRVMSKMYDPRYLEDQSSRQLYERAQEMQRTGDEYGANLMNIRAAERTRREEPEERASGGAANGKPHKDAALHKALEIIQMMLSRR